MNGWVGWLVGSVVLEREDEAEVFFVCIHRDQLQR